MADERMSDAQRRRLAGMLAAASVPDTPSGATPGEAALAVGGMAAGPIAGRIAQASPKALAAILATLGFATPSEAENDSPYDRKMRDFTTQQASVRAAVDKLKAEREALVKAADIERQSGAGPRWKEKQTAVTEWDKAYGQDLRAREADLVSIGSRMDAYDKENSPAAVRKRNAEMPTKELFPGATMATQGALAIGGLATSMAMKGRNVSRYNAEVKELSESLKTTNAGRSKDPSYATALTDRLTALERAGPSKSGTLAPTIAGFELGAFAPTAADYYRSGGDPDSPLYKKAVKSVVGGESVKEMLGYEVPGADLTARILMAGLLGAGASKIGNTAVDAAIGRERVPRAQMIRAQVQPPSGGPPGGPGGGPAPVPAAIPGGPAGGQQAIAPPIPPAPRPNNPGPPAGPTPNGQPNNHGASAASPYTPQHSAISAQYIDELMAAGQPLPAGPVMSAELAQRYGNANMTLPSRSNTTQAANRTKTAIEAGADPKGLLGKAGFLAVPGAIVGSGDVLPPDIMAAIVRQLMQNEQ